MSYQLIFHPKAAKEYSEAWRWYEQEQVGLGDRFEKLVELQLQKITEYPENYSIRKAPYREAAVGIFPFVIVYKLNKRKKSIYISAIYHTNRNPRYKYRK